MEGYFMLKNLSKKDANTLFLYEPIESEYRTQAYNKWRNLGISMYGQSRKRMEQKSGI
jgi:hypothetical protein